ncbi:hypothetical protein KNE206_40800 [Kitasatospora sp. NE20-6]|uniref:DUF5709 domain-containing protein n=1 Tax=Kitasatospora sp. NE20-6 TaxID=2859066 RepID=UPI0034DC3882
MSNGGTENDGPPTGGGDDQQDTGPLDPENTLDDRGYDDVLDEGYSPPERPYGVDRPGTTVAEQRDGESLDRRLARELPEIAPDDGDGIGDLADGDGEPVDREVGDDRAGRLVAPDEGAHGTVDREMLASDVGIDGGAACAEEAAMHIVPAEELGTDAP